MIAVSITRLLGIKHSISIDILHYWYICITVQKFHVLSNIEDEGLPKCINFNVSSELCRIVSVSSVSCWWPEIVAKVVASKIHNTRVGKLFVILAWICIYKAIANYMYFSTIAALNKTDRVYWPWLRGACFDSCENEQKQSSTIFMHLSDIIVGSVTLVVHVVLEQICAFIQLYSRP